MDRVALACLNSFSIIFIVLFLLVFYFDLLRSRLKRYDFIVIIDVDLNCLWIVLYDNDNIWYEMISMTSQRGILVYIYLYDDVYDDFTLDLRWWYLRSYGTLWKDLCRGRIVGIICVAPTVGGVANVSTTMGMVMWGSHSVTAWLTQTNISVGQSYISYFLILLLNIYMYYVFKIYMYYLKEH